MPPLVAVTDPDGLIDPLEPAEALMVYVVAENDAVTVQFAVMGLVV